MSNDPDILWVGGRGGGLDRPAFAFSDSLWLKGCFFSNQGPVSRFQHTDPMIPEDEHKDANWSGLNTSFLSSRELTSYAPRCPLVCSIQFIFAMNIPAGVDILCTQ